MLYLRRSEPVPVTIPVRVVVVDMAVVVVVDVVAVVEPVFIVGMTAAESFCFSFSLSALSSDQYLSLQGAFSQIINMITIKFSCFYDQRKGLA